MWIVISIEFFTIFLRCFVWSDDTLMILNECKFFLCIYQNKTIKKFYEFDSEGRFYVVDITCNFEFYFNFFIVWSRWHNIRICHLQLMNVNWNYKCLKQNWIQCKRHDYKTDKNMNCLWWQILKCWTFNQVWNELMIPICRKLKKMFS